MTADTLDRPAQRAPTQPQGQANPLTDTVQRLSQQRRKPVQLQARNALGIYWNVARFDADDELAEHYVRNACELLSAVDTSLNWRVVAPLLGGASVNVLLTYSATDGWKPA